jgi:DNA mismatch repair protein MutS
MGDFYELFFDDAEKAAAALGITLTKRGNHQRRADPDGRACRSTRPRPIWRKLIRMGFKVAVCEQIEDPAEAKKRGSKSIVVRRDIVRVVTPGTLTEDGLLDARGANRLAAVAMRKGRRPWPRSSCRPARSSSVAWSLEDLAAILAAWRRPRPGPRPPVLRRCGAPGPEGSGGMIQPMPSALPSRRRGDRVKRLYGVDTLDGFGAFEEAEISALGLIAAHLETTQAGKLPALRAAAPRGRGRRDGHRPGDAPEPGDRPHPARRARRLAAGLLDRTVTSGGARALAAPGPAAAGPRRHR